MTEKTTITEYADARDRDQVIALWREVFGYEAAHNDPQLVIDKKLAVDDGLFFVARTDERVVGTVMAGYDGHRGWIYSLAVLPEHQNHGVGTALLDRAEQALTLRGCVKLNLQIMADNADVRRFYEAHGFLIEDRISMGKRLDG